MNQGHYTRRRNNQGQSFPSNGYDARRTIVSNTQRDSTISVNEEEELELIRTILGEDVPTDIILQCFTQARFDIATTINLYFAGINTVTIDVTKSIRSGMPITLHELNHEGMLAKSESHATLTSGNEANDKITLENEKFKSMRLRKRGGGTGQFFQNGDIVSIECHGLWLKTTKLSKLCKWKSPCDDDRNKFIISGLPQGQYLTIHTSFQLLCYKWKNRQVIKRMDKHFTTQSHNLHRCLIGIEKVSDVTEEQKLLFNAKFTPRVAQSLPQPGESKSTLLSCLKPNEQNQSLESISEAISLSGLKINEMLSIVGKDKSKELMLKYLDGAGGNVEIAIEHYFMNETTKDNLIMKQTSNSQLLIPMPISLHPPSLFNLTLDEEEEEEDDDDDDVIKKKNEEKEDKKEKKSDNRIIQPMDKKKSVKHEKMRMMMDSSKVLYPSQKKMNDDDDDNDNESISLGIKDFEMISVLGRGSFGAVMMVRYKKDGRIFAIKILKKSNMDQCDVANVMEERQILQRLHHPFVSSLVFAFQTNERLYLGMKYYAGGDLFYHLNERGHLSLEDARLYSAELVLAISYLHDLNILYRDLKPSNIMLDKEGHVNIVDFGLSKQHILQSNHGVKTLSGTAEYVAPEALVCNINGNRDYGKAFDWWSLGIVLYEMIVGQSPFYHENEAKMLHDIVNKEIIYPKDLDTNAKNLIQNLLIRDPSKRLGSRENGVEEIMNHSFFHGIDWNCLMERKVQVHWKPKLSSETDTRYVDPEFIEQGRSSSTSKDPFPSLLNNSRFSQFSFALKEYHEKEEKEEEEEKKNI